MVPYRLDLAAAAAAYEVISLSGPSQPAITTRTDQTISRPDVPNHPVEPDGAVSETPRGTRTAINPLTAKSAADDATDAQWLLEDQMHPAFGNPISVVTGRERETPTSLRLRLVRPL